jgi:hypothetical protein
MMAAYMAERVFAFRSTWWRHIVGRKAALVTYTLSRRQWDIPNWQWWWHWSTTAMAVARQAGIIVEVNTHVG